MRHLILVPLFVLLAACGPESCECAGPGTVARKPTAYRGNPTANLPYIETGRITLRDLGCQGSLCEMWAGLGPVIHNPLNTPVIVTIRCQYWLDDAKLVKASPAKDVKVIGPASRKFEGFDLLFNTEAGTNFGLAVRCTADFQGGYPSNYSDASN